MPSRRYWPGVLLTMPIGVLLGLWIGIEMDRIYTPAGSSTTFVMSSAIFAGGTALGAMVGALIATRRVEAPVGSSEHLLGVAVGGAVGALGFWVVLVVAAVILSGGFLAGPLAGLGIVAAAAAGLLTAGGVATADLAARWTRRLRAD